MPLCVCPCVQAAAAGFPGMEHGAAANGSTTAGARLHEEEGEGSFTPAGTIAYFVVRDLDGAPHPGTSPQNIRVKYFCGA